MEREIEGCKADARQSVLLQCLDTDNAQRPIAIDWRAFDTPFEEAGSMPPLLRHEVEQWLKTVWALLRPYEERLTLDAFKYEPRCAARVRAVCQWAGRGAVCSTLCRYEALQDASFRAKRLPFCETCCLNIQETALDLLVETNPTGHVQADGFFSRFLLVQQSAQKKLSKRKKIVTISDSHASPAAAARAPDATAFSSPSLLPPPALALASHSRLDATHLEALEEALPSPSSPGKLANMQHRKEPSWSALTQPGSNQVLWRETMAGNAGCGSNRARGARW